MNIAEFRFNESSVRTVDIDGKIYFVAKDVTEMLKYKHSSKATNHCKNPVSAENLLKGGGETPPPLDKNFQPHTIMIPESDVWRLIIKSRLPEAQKIEQWIFEEVLPTIRKQGVYTPHKELQAKFAKEVAEYEDKINELETQVYDLKEELDEDAKEDRRYMLERQNQIKASIKLFMKRYTKRGDSVDFHELYSAYQNSCSAKGEPVGTQLVFESVITTANRFAFERPDGKFVAHIELDKAAMRKDFRHHYKEWTATV